MKTQLTPEQQKELMDNLSLPLFKEMVKGFRTAKLKSYYSLLGKKYGQVYGLFLYKAGDNYQSLEADMVDAVEKEEKRLKTANRPITKTTFANRAKELIQKAGEELRIAMMLRESETGAAGTFKKMGETYSVIITKDGGKAARAFNKSEKKNKA